MRRATRYDIMVAMHQLTVAGTMALSRRSGWELTAKGERWIVAVARVLELEAT